MEDIPNPYASPTADAIEAVQMHGQYEIATRGKRFANFFVDQLLCRILGFGSGYLVGLAFVAAGNEVNANSQTTLSIMGFLAGLIAFATFYIVFEHTTGRTPGKFLTGTKVVDVDGGKPRLGQIVGRTFARMIPFEIFSFLGSTCVGWHDSLSGTRVVTMRR